MKETARLFEKLDADAVLILSEKNRMYFTGFSSTFGVLMILRKRAVFFTDPRYFEMAEAIADEKLEVKCVANGEAAFDKAISALKKAKCKTVGFEDTEITVAEFKNISEKFAQFTLLPAGDAIAAVRSIKTEEEIENVRTAQTITDAAFGEMLKFIKAGMSERDVAVELEYRLNKLGAHGLAFETIVASGINTSKPHAHPTAKKIEYGDALTMDFGAAYNGYCSDMTRTIFVGEPSREMRNIYNIVHLAQKTAINNAYCGMTGRELDSLAREVIVANGMGGYFTHSTGHSLGIDIHEEPRASAQSNEKLVENQFITVEPGIYIPGVGGVRIEDLLLIKEDGVIDLTTSDKNIIIL